MNKAIEFFKDGSVTMKKVNSPINGKLTVRWDTFSGYQIMGGGLWQVGGPVENVWKEGLKKLPREFEPKNILILGLGGGTIAKLSRKKWSKVQMVGVDVDEVIVQLGREYMGLNKFDVETYIEDAFSFVKGVHDKSFNLTCIDLYVGDNFPEKFNSDEFVKELRRVTTNNGFVMVNRLYEGRDTALAEKFRKKLTKYFKKVEDLHLLNEANVVYICS